MFFQKLTFFFINLQTILYCIVRTITNNDFKGFFNDDAIKVR